jgi:dephospho-CoA kinase
MKMKVIGVTGGVGAGKSSVLKYFRENENARLLIADEIAHDLMEPGGACYPKLCELLGNSVLKEDGTIDRMKMAEVIFGDDSIRKKVNAIVHPAVQQYIKDALAKEREQSQKDYVIIEAALFIEEKCYELCDESWYVYTSEENRTQRLMRDRHYSKEKVESIMASQVAHEVFLQYCQVVIDNNGDYSQTAEQIRKELCKV